MEYYFIATLLLLMALGCVIYTIVRDKRAERERINSKIQWDGIAQTARNHERA